MDGYSIKEAATVLGIPKRRVWELIARGVLSGAPEADGGMRVFLQPRATPPSAERRAADEPRTNGNGGHPEPTFEASPFREVLTEFRMLTERYGQALLALGEARGEVAALRSRVEQLEARIDLRLPGPRPASTVAWEMPDRTVEPPSAPEPEAEVAAAPIAEETPMETDAEAPPAVAAEAAPEPEPEPWAEIPVTEPVAPEPPAVEPSMDEVLGMEGAAPAEPEPAAEPAEEQVTPPAEDAAPPTRRRRTRRTRPAIAAFSAALERAQDPTLAELPGAREAGEAMAAYQRQIEDLGLREPLAEVPAAADAPVAGDELSALDEAIAAEEPPVAPEPMAAAEALPEEVAAEVEILDEVAGDEEPIFEPMDVAPVPLEALVDAATEETAAMTEVEPVEAPEPEAEAAPPVSGSTYTTEVVEPDWFADGDFTWLDTSQGEGEAAEAAEIETVAEHETAPEAATEDVGALEAIEAGAPEAAEVAEPEAAESDAPELVEPELAAPETESAWAPAEPTVEVGQSEDVAEAQAEVAGGPVEARAEEVARETVAEPEDDVAEAVAEEVPADEAVAIEEPSFESRADATNEAAVAVADEVAFEPLEAVVPPGAEREPEPPAATTAEARPQDEEELMWLGDEFVTAELELETPGWGTHQARSAKVEPAPLLELTDAELAQLASEEGWEPTEVEAIRTFLGRGTAAASGSSPAADAFSPGIPDDVHPLEEAPPPSQALATEHAQPEVEAGVEQPAAARPPAAPHMSAPLASSAPGDPSLRGSPGQTERDWLRGRRGPAATAYRRLRRLFPG